MFLCSEKVSDGGSHDDDMKTQYTTHNETLTAHSERFSKKFAIAFVLSLLLLATAADAATTRLARRVKTQRRSKTR